MHEAAITQDLLALVLANIPRDSVLCEVHIEVGELEHLDTGAMETLWEAAIADTSAAGSTLLIKLVPVLVRCSACKREYQPEDPAILMCPFCRRVLPDVLTGTGFVLKSLEVEKTTS